MTKNVLVTISGTHYDENVRLPEENGDLIEVIAPAVYYLKDGRHYVIYDEPVEGMPGVVHNRISFREGEFLAVVKTGLANTRLLFEKDRINVTRYQTSYGEMVVGTYTKELDVDVTEQEIRVYVRYSLDVSGDKIADCDIRIKITGTG